MSLFSVGKRFLLKYPRLIKTVSFLYNSFSFNRIKCKGNNKIINSSAFMKHCKICTNGTGNEIVFAEK